MIIKLIILSSLWFLFGIYTGYKLFASIKKLDIHFPENWSDEEMDKFIEKLAEKLKHEDEN